MRSNLIVPCLWFDDQAEQAAAFYTDTFPGGRVIAVSHYPESFDNPGGKPRGSVLTVEFEVAGQRFTALNGGPQFSMNPSISFFVNVDSADEANRLFSTLEDRGSVLMPLDAYPWSERYGHSCVVFDGKMWRRPGGPVIAPCLMFSGARHGLAEAALQKSAEIFPDGTIHSLERYAEGEGPEGTLKHGRVVVANQDLIAMDSHIDHGIDFNEGISLQVMCANQQEIDRYWEALASDGGAPGRCGWLKDQFGISWQVVPQGHKEWFTTSDAAARDRVFAAVLEMEKLDIATLQAAFDGLRPHGHR